MAYSKWRVANPKIFTEPEFPPVLKAMRWLGRQTWIPRGQDKALRLLWNPDSGRHFPFEVGFFGMRYQGDLAHNIDWSVFAYGSYSYYELSLLRELASLSKLQNKETNFFDVGANAGHHTLFMAPIADQVIAFEPYPELHAIIDEKIELNNLRNVKVLPFALGEQDCDQPYFPGGGSNSGMGTFVTDHGEGFDNPLTLPVRNGDRLFDDLALPRIDILKIDVEGFEPFVLRGLSSRLQRDRPAILMEWSEKSQLSITSENDFRALFYADPVFAEVRGREGCPFQLESFELANARELLVLPREKSSFIADRISSS